ncbi:hypothetical protein VTN96DRAFT_5069 [Rasamsonia emersonii]
MGVQKKGRNEECDRVVRAKYIYIFSPVRSDDKQMTGRKTVLSAVSASPPPTTDHATSLSVWKLRNQASPHGHLWVFINSKQLRKKKFQSRKKITQKLRQDHPGERHPMLMQILAIALFPDNILEFFLFFPPCSLGSLLQVGKRNGSWGFSFFLFFRSWGQKGKKKRNRAIAE